MIFHSMQIWRTVSFLFLRFLRNLGGAVIANVDRSEARDYAYAVFHEFT